MGQRSHQQRNWSTFGKWQTADGQWTDQIFERIRFQFLHCPLKEHEFRGKGSPSKTKTNSEPLLDAQVAMQSKTTEGHKPIQIVVEGELKGCLRIAPRGAARLDRRNEVINEALAEDVQRENRGKRDVTILLQQ